jgi:anti-sigma factor RsiW
VTNQERLPGNDAHREFDELAVGWALHALEPEDEARFVTHLPGCARCADTVAETQEVMAAMASDIPPAEPSDELRSRLRAAVAETAQVPAPPAVVPAEVASTPRAHDTPSDGGPSLIPMRPRRRMLAGALVATAFAAVAGLGVWNVVLNSDRQQLQATVAEQNAVVDALLSPGRATIAPLDDEGRRLATVVVRDGELQVVAEGLAVNGRDTTYVVWGLEGESATALGTFDVTRSQLDVRTVGSGVTGLDQFPGYGISLEPGQEAPSAPTDVVATGQVTS